MLWLHFLELVPNSVGSSSTWLVLFGPLRSNNELGHVVGVLAIDEETEKEGSRHLNPLDGSSRLLEEVAERVEVRDDEDWLR